MLNHAERICYFMTNSRLPAYISMNLINYDIYVKTKNRPIGSDCSFVFPKYDGRTMKSENLRCQNKFRIIRKEQIK